MNNIINLDLRHCPALHWTDRSQWILLADVKIMGVCVPKGFSTDGASVPRLLWWLFSPTGRYMSAAVLHDYLIKHPETGTRRQADDVFLDAMQSMGVVTWRRYMLFSAVRLWGVVKSLWQGMQ